MSCTLPLAFLVILGFISIPAAASCEYYIQRGTPFSIPLNYKELSSKELTWKHNGNVIFKRKKGNIKPGKAEDISNEGSLKLKELTLADKGTYTAEVFDSDGKICHEKSFILCVMEKISKPSVKFTCSDKDVIFTCTLTNTEGVTFKWSQNRKLLVGKTETTLTIGLKQLKEPDTFTCSAVNNVSTETSNPIKPTCNGTVCFKGLNCNSLCVSLCLSLSLCFCPSLSIFLLVSERQKFKMSLFCSTPHPPTSYQLSQTRVIVVYCLVLIS
uniref:Ig-like domain-containing protein n=1 Tax=Hucho hucho TaxID=62062 RepID=A0A4W5QW80_9TELE